MSQSTIDCIFVPENSDEADDDGFSINQNFKILYLKYHRKGMFAICDDGYVRILEGSVLLPSKQGDTKVSIKSIIQLPTTNLTNASFNMQYTWTAISSNQGIFLLNNPHILESIDKQYVGYSDASEHGFVKLVVDFDTSKTVGLANVNPQGQNFVVLKENGCLQIWNLKLKKIINRFLINEQCTSLSSHAKMPLLAVGTSSGHIIFINIHDINNIFVIEKCLVHTKSVKMLKFNTSGTMLFSIGDDNKLFVIDNRLSDKVQDILLDKDQRLVTNNVKVDSFETGFFVLGYMGK